MTITPEQAKTLNCNDYPRPWEIGQVPVFDAWDDYEEAWYAGPAIVYDEDIAPLVAAAPVMAEQIAGMRPEYRAEFQTAAGQWFPTPHRCSCSSGWGTKQQAARHAADWKDDGYATRIVRRLVSKPEEIS